VNGPYMPKNVIDGKIVDKPWSEWSDSESKKAQFDCMDKNIITSALNLDEFFMVSQCSSAKEMWDILEVTHEGTSDVKRVTKLVLIQEYGLFRMQDEETIADVQKRFTHIVNHLIGLGKIFDKEELNIKVPKCLVIFWQPKVTRISKTRDLTTLSTTAMFGKLREHEFEMNRFKEREIGERKVIEITLKIATLGEESETDSNEDSEVEPLDLLSRKFNKFLRKKGKVKNQQYKRYSKETDSNAANFTCFGCGKQGHIKMECPNLTHKEKATEKKKFSKHSKGKRAYIVWDEND